MQQTSSPQPTLPIDIPAAMAISGRTPANEELPYMTPPLLHVGIFRKIWLQILLNDLFLLNYFQNVKKNEFNYLNSPSK